MGEIRSWATVEEDMGAKGDMKSKVFFFFSNDESSWKIFID